MAETSNPPRLEPCAVALTAAAAVSATATIAIRCTSSVLLPAKTEAQEVRPTQQAHVLVGVIESELDVAFAVAESTAHREPLTAQRRGALRGGESRAGAGIDVVVGRGRVATARRQAEPGVAEVRHGV